MLWLALVMFLLLMLLLLQFVAVTFVAGIAMNGLAGGVDDVIVMSCACVVFSLDVCLFVSLSDCLLLWLLGPTRGPF